MGDFLQLLIAGAATGAIYASRRSARRWASSTLPPLGKK